jgi:mRNA-degrading endonuclease RelE of RelBE toxin-antitoxin system
MYSIKLHPKVDKFIRKCEGELAERIRVKLRTLKDDPFRYLEHFSGDDFYKFRIGEFRALIDVDMKNHVLFVRHMDNRSKIYKRL